MGLIGKDELPVVIPVALSLPLFIALAQPDFFACLEEWQTLVAAVLALWGAWLTIGTIREQIDQADRHKQQDLQRHYRALKVVFPMTLSRLCEWSRETAHNINAHRSEAVKSIKKGYGHPSFEPVPLPDSSVAEIQEFLRSTNNDTVISLLKKIVQEIQIVQARVAGFNDHSLMHSSKRLERDADNWIIQAAQIYSMVEALFEYSREDAEEPPLSISWERVNQFLLRERLVSPSLNLLVTKRLQKGPDFWSL